MGVQYSDIGESGIKHTSNKSENSQQNEDYQIWFVENHSRATTDPGLSHASP